MLVVTWGLIGAKAYGWEIWRTAEVALGGSLFTMLGSRDRKGRGGLGGREEAVKAFGLGLAFSGTNLCKAWKVGDCLELDRGSGRSGPSVVSTSLREEFTGEGGEATVSEYRNLVFFRLELFWDMEPILSSFVLMAGKENRRDVRDSGNQDFEGRAGIRRDRDFARPSAAVSRTSYKARMSPTVDRAPEKDRVLSSVVLFLLETELYVRELLARREPVCRRYV